MDQYKCVHEVKAPPLHPYSPATSVWGTIQAVRKGIVEIEELQSKAKMHSQN